MFWLLTSCVWVSGGDYEDRVAFYEDDCEESTWWRDLDADGFGGIEGVLACDVPAGYVAEYGDCDDEDPSTHPAASELCDGLNNDCDNEVDEGALDRKTWYRDGDGDGWGVTALTIQACDPPEGYALRDGDCQDKAPEIHPGAIELCDGARDEDCDGVVDEAGAKGAALYWPDVDGDGYGDADGESTSLCGPTPGYSSNRDDCDDDNVFVAPGANESCDGKDQDCDGVVDEDPTDGADWHPDVDADGYGSDRVTQRACEAPDDYIADASDCDDGDDTVHPDAEEICGDGADNDCDGLSNGCALEGEFTLETAGALVGASVGEQAGIAIAGAGDVDGDGVDELLVGAWGRVYVVPADTSLGEDFAGPAALDEAALAVLDQGEEAGPLVPTSAGDGDRDGYADLMIGHPEADGGAGLVWLLNGPVVGALDIAPIAAAALLGPAPGAAALSSQSAIYIKHSCT